MSEPLIRAIESIYRSAAEPALWPVTLQSIADCFDDVGAVLIYGKDDGSFGAFGSASLAPLLRDWSAEWNGLDTRAVRVRERGHFFSYHVVTDSDLFAPEEFKTEPYYYDLLARHGLKYFVGMAVSPDPRIEVGVSVQRSICKPEYSDAELQLMARLGPHVERSLRLGIHIMDAELSKLGLGEALARIGIGVFILDPLRRIVFMNPASETLLGDGLEIVDNRLVVGSAMLNRQAHDAIQRMVDGGLAHLMAEQRPILIHRRRHVRPLILYVLPIPMADSAMSQFLGQARVIVLAIDPEDAQPPDPSLIRDILGLTLGEARVASLVGTGVSPRDAAQKLGIAEETARSTLKRIFSKVGVSRQSELTALMSRFLLK